MCSVSEIGYNAHIEQTTNHMKRIQHQRVKIAAKERFKRKMSGLVSGSGIVAYKDSPKLQIHSSASDVSRRRRTMDKDVVNAHANGGLDSDSDVDEPCCGGHVDEPCCGGGGGDFDQRSVGGINAPSDRKVITDAVHTDNTNSASEKTDETSAPEKTVELSAPEKISTPEKTIEISVPEETDEIGHCPSSTQISLHADKDQNTDVSTETENEFNFDMGDCDFEVSVPSCEFDIKAMDDSNPKQGDEGTIEGDHSVDAADEEDKEDANKDSGLDSDISSISAVQLETIPSV